jgi:hypothetical protein
MKAAVLTPAYFGRFVMLSQCPLSQMCYVRCRDARRTAQCRPRVPGVGAYRRGADADISTPLSIEGARDLDQQGRDAITVLPRVPPRSLCNSSGRK